MRAERINRFAKLCGARRYLEVGVCHGETFFLVNVPFKVAVDPLFRFDVDQHRDKKTLFFQEPSDTFFAGYKGDPFDIIYLDGLHTFDQTTRDFFNSQRLAHDRTIWILDDTVPNDVFSALPDQQLCYRLRKETGGDDWSWMGDVFKSVFLIERTSPFFRSRTFSGHGQTVVWKEKTARPIAADTVSMELIGSMTYADFVANLGQMRISTDEVIFADVERALLG